MAGGDFLPESRTYLVGLPESQQLVSEQFPHLRIFDDAAQGPREQVRIPAIARVEGHA